MKYLEKKFYSKPFAKKKKKKNRAGSSDEKPEGKQQGHKYLKADKWNRETKASIHPKYLKWVACFKKTCKANEEENLNGAFK